MTITGTAVSMRPRAGQLDPFETRIRGIEGWFAKVPYREKDEQDLQSRRGSAIKYALGGGSLIEVRDFESEEVVLVIHVLHPV